MEVLSVSLSSLPSIQSHRRAHQFEPRNCFPCTSSFPHEPSVGIALSLRTPVLSHLSAGESARSSKLPTTLLLAKCSQNHSAMRKTEFSVEILTTHLSLLLEDRVSAIIAHSRSMKKVHLHFLSAMISLAVHFPSSAAEAVVSSEQASDKINIESILVAIDNFFNRYPFFVATVTFIWLVVIPLAEEYSKKYKPIAALDGYRKLKDDPNAQLLDIRKRKMWEYLASPNLKSINKKAIQVEFSEGKEDSFVAEVLQTFNDPGRTVICVLDDFDGNSLEVAELLFKGGFKEAYAIKGGLRGKDGWQGIQENLLPPPLHVYPRKTKKKVSDLGLTEDKKMEAETENASGSVSTSIDRYEERKLSEDGHINAKKTASEANFITLRSSSPYPNYPDLKPPSSPTPSKPSS